jgi:hypothetical protein
VTLFGIGLDLQGAASRVSDTNVRNLLQANVDQIDAAIRAIREAVFSLNPDKPSAA